MIFGRRNRLTGDAFEIPATMTSDPIDPAIIIAFQQGDAQAFDHITRRYARELRLHCYRMTGSLDDAEDVLQETLMRAWNKRDSYEGRAGIRPWLYRIATNACIDAARAHTARRAAEQESGASAYTRFPWLQPYPDTLLTDVVSEAERPDERVVARDTIEL